MLHHKLIFLAVCGMLCGTACAGNIDDAVAAADASLRLLFPGLSNVHVQYQVDESMRNGGAAGKYYRGCISLAPELETCQPDVIAYVYRHEFGHAIWEQLSMADRQAVSRDIRASEINYHENVAEVWANLFADVTGLKMRDDLRDAQRIIRRRLYR